MLTTAKTQTQTSTLVLSNVTCIDHAYIDENARIQGRSYMASFMVTGEVEPNENVVVDFSNIKKRIKASVDHKETGFDHKLWVSGEHVIPHLHQLAQVLTSKAALTLPDNAVKVVSGTSLTDIRSAELEIASQVRGDLAAQGLDVTIRCVLTEEAQMFPSGKSCVSSRFTYVHGLKNSSSFGCQNLAHGHTSYIQLIGTFSTEASALADEIASALDNTVFVFSENLYGINSSQSLCAVQYQSRDRGLMQARFEDHKCIVLETETTVEHLVEYVVCKYGDQMREVGASSFILSEGLCKGSWYDLSNPSFKE